jgi:hypothetical protein
MIDKSYGYAFTYKNINFYNGRHGGYIGELIRDNNIHAVFVSQAEIVTWPGPFMALVDAIILQVEMVIENTERW